MTMTKEFGLDPIRDLKLDISEERLKYWGRNRHYSFLPQCVQDIVLGWIQGSIFSIDQPGSCMPELSESQKTVKIPTTLPIAWALSTRACGQRLWLFSHQAFHAAIRARESWNIGRIIGGPFAVRWINSFDSLSLKHFSRRIFTYGPSPVPGFLAYWSGDQTILWHPLILGPAGLWDCGRIRPSTGLDIREDGKNNWSWRGEAVTDGTWRAGRFYPLLAPGGWFSPKIYQN